MVVIDKTIVDTVHRHCGHRRRRAHEHRGRRVLTGTESRGAYFR